MNKLSNTLAVVGLSVASGLSFAASEEDTNVHEHHAHQHHKMQSNADLTQEVLKKSPVSDSSLAGLTNHDGEIVDDADFEGKKRLVFFGFTYCPEVCPMGMATLSAALRQIDEKYGEMAEHLLGENTVIVLVSTDPVRDTPARMKEWLGYFDDRIVGLTGAAEILEEKAENYRANRFGHHVPYVFILNENGDYQGIVNTKDGVDAVRQAIEEVVLKPVQGMDHSHHHGHDM
ncbi:MAG: SCO family protein [Alphaproteobacteria bacterium]